MDETPHQPQQKDRSANNEQPTMKQRLPDVPAHKPGVQGDPGGFDATTEGTLLHVLQSLIPLTGENLDQWTWEERRDFLNWCLDEGILMIQDGKLVPVGEQLVPTASLRHDTHADSPKSAEDTRFLHDAERAKLVIAANPAINVKELAEALGLSSAVYAHTLKRYINAHKSAQEGAE